MFFTFSFSGVWGSAFSILFNRVLGVSNSQNKGPTMEEELGNIKQLLVRFSALSVEGWHSAGSNFKNVEFK